MSNSLNLELPYVEGSQSQKHVTVNDAFRRIDSVVQLTVDDRNRTSPPASPQEGDRHIVAANATGPWDGEDFAVAAYQDGAWVFFEPKEGWVGYSRSEQALVYYNGANWEIFTAVGAAETAAKFGVNGAADDTNRLVVNSEAALFAPDNTQAVPTGDMRVIVNKTGNDDTAAHLFQRNYSGRAEFGLLGSNDFSLKVSNNGSDWTESFSVAAGNGRVDFNELPAVGGEDGLVVSYASRSAAENAQIPTAVKHIEVRGYASENDGGLSRYRRVGVLPSDGLGFEDGSGGFWRLEGDVVYARQAGAVGDGSTDDTNALRRALNSGRNLHLGVGRYFITNVIFTSAAFQRIVGEGRGRSVIVLDSSFNMNAAGVIRLDHNFTTVQDVSIQFDQSSASSRATLIEYPPAIWMVDHTRVRLIRLRFQEAWDGVHAVGNCGGAIFDDVECGSFNIGFRLGGSLDTVELRNCRVWPYDFAGNTTLLNIFSDGNNVGFRIGRVDDLKMSNCTPFRSKIIFEASDGFKPFGTVTGLALDGSNSSIEMRDGEITISSLYATTDVANDSFIVQTGGILAVSDFSFKVNSLANVPMVNINDSAAVCVIQNGRVQMGSSPNVEGFRVSDGKLTVSSLRFSVDPTVVRTGACIRQINGELMAYGNTVNGNTTGSGPFIRVQTDGQHSIFGNDSNGWEFDFPGVRSAGTYGPNHNGAALALDRVLAIGPNDNNTEGGEIRLDGAGSFGNVRIDNKSGNVRFFTLAANKSLDVVSSDGTASLRGDGLSFSNGVRLDRGNADEGSSTSVGDLALASTTSGTGNTATGRRALEALTSGDNNVGLGALAGKALLSGSHNVMCGYQAGTSSTNGSGLTLLGFRAGQQLGAGSGNTGVGRNTFSGVSGNLSNATALGDGATVTGSNQVQLGNSATTTFAYGAVQQRSDGRDKTDVRDTVLGLDFVRALRPVDYRWNYREDYQDHEIRDDEGLDDHGPDDADANASSGAKVRCRFHHGFIAQEIEQIIQQTGEDFGGFQDHGRSGGKDVKSIGYTELIAPVVRAIQELAARVDALAATQNK